MIGKLFAVLSGFILTISGWMLWSWYVSWLDKYFLWEYIALLISIPTLPLMPVAIVIESIWHSIPMVVMSGIFWIIVAFLLGLAGGRISKIPPSEMGARSHAGIIAAIVLIVINQGIMLINKLLN